MFLSISLAFTTAVALAALFVLRSIFRAATSPLKHIPGPFEARFTRFWYLRRIWSGDFPYANIDLHRRYGPIVRIAPNQYSIDDPNAANQFYSSSSSFVKSEWYAGWSNPIPGTYPDLFTDQDPKSHAANKRLVASLYSMTNIAHMEDRVNENIALLVRNFQGMAEEKQVFDMEHWFQCYAHDVIGAITLDQRFGLLESGDDRGLFKALDSNASLSSCGGVFRELHRPFISLVIALKFPNPFAPILDFSEEQICKRISRRKQDTNHEQSSTSDDDFLGAMLTKHADDPEKFPPGLIRATAIQNIVAGSDTTSISLSAIMYYLIKNSQTLRKLRSEISEALSSKIISRPITYQQSQRLPYLQAVIKEAMRLHPATGLPLARVVPSGGTEISGQLFPAHTVVGINPWVAHRNSVIFGEDAEYFRPERWLKSKEEISKLDAYYLAFGSGSRTCIGKNISMLEMANLVPELVMKYDFEFADPDLKLRTKNVWFVKQTNLFCKVKTRDESLWADP